MRDDRHVRMLPMGCKASAPIKPSLNPPTRQYLGEQSLARQMMRFIETIKEQISAPASVT